jgi:disulfide bond formation protein DsbB
MISETSRILNTLGLLAVSLILIVGFYDQIVVGDMPCPLCILERVGFLGAAFGLALNVKFGPRASHYAVVILSAFFGSLISVRHTLLHIVPGTGTYGNAIMGLHFYTWALIAYEAIILGTAIMLLFDRQFANSGAAGQRQSQSQGVARKSSAATFGVVMIAIAALLALSNGVSTVLECAGGLCPDNPVSYMLLSK